MITKSDYEEIIQEIGFEEVPLISLPNEVKLPDFLIYEELDLDLKIHLVEILIVRSFPAVPMVYMPINIEWMVRGFLSEYKFHPVKHWETENIIEAIEMIMSDSSSRVHIGTVFLFTIIEFYGKQKLGYNPSEYDFFDKRKKHFTDMTINQVFIKLMKSNTLIARSLNRIDKLSKKISSELGIQKDRFNQITIVDRMTFYRNIMLHGEAYFSHKGKYLVAMYMLFYLNDLKEQLPRELEKVKCC